MAPHALSSGDTFTTDVLLVARHVIHGMVCSINPYLVLSPSHFIFSSLSTSRLLLFTVVPRHLLSFMFSSGSCLSFFLPFSVSPLVLYTFFFWFSGASCRNPLFFNNLQATSKAAPSPALLNELTQLLRCVFTDKDTHALRAGVSPIDMLALIRCWQGAYGVHPKVTVPICVQVRTCATCLVFAISVLSLQVGWLFRP